MLGDVEGAARARPVRRHRRARDRGPLARRRGARCSSSATRAWRGVLRENLARSRSARSSAQVRRSRRARGASERKGARRDIRSVFIDPPYRRAQEWGADLVGDPAGAAGARGAHRRRERPALAAGARPCEIDGNGATATHPSQSTVTHDTRPENHRRLPRHLRPDHQRPPRRDQARGRPLRERRRGGREPLGAQERRAVRHRRAASASSSGRWRDVENVRVEPFSTLVVDFARKIGATRDRQGPARDLRLRVRAGDEPAQPPPGPEHRVRLPDGQPAVQFPFIQRRQGARHVRRARSTTWCRARWLRGCRKSCSADEMKATETVSIPSASRGA